jgi:hypothetical protein
VGTSLVLSLCAQCVMCNARPQESQFLRMVRRGDRCVCIGRHHGVRCETGVRQRHVRAQA